MKLTPLMILTCLSACINPFAPELDLAETLGNIITDQQTPDEVLQNFSYAYAFKDSLLYSDVLDESFVFEYFDPGAGPSGGFLNWGRDVDLKTTGQLFRAFDAINLVWLNTFVREIRNGQERRFIRFNLSLFAPDFNFLITGTAIFTFVQNDDDKKWRIIRWQDESDL